MSDQDEIVTMSLKAAAAFMGVSRRHARRILNERHRNNPRAQLLLRPSGSAEGHIEINVRAFRVIMLARRDQELEELERRVGFCESDIASLQVRTGKIEKSTSQQKTCRNMGGWP